MSFGFSVGDFIAVGKLAFGVYRSCRDAPDSFGNIALEVLSLHAVLKEVEEILSEEHLTATKQNSLAVITQGCDAVLKDLQQLVSKYESLGTQSKRTWDRMKWGLNDINELRGRLTSNTVLLTAFMNTCQISVERKLHKLVQDAQQGRFEGSVVTTATVESLSAENKEMWRAIRKDLEDIGISVEAFESNKTFIFNWLRIALENGAFDEVNVEGNNEVDRSIYADDDNETVVSDASGISTTTLPQSTEVATASLAQSRPLSSVPQGSVQPITGAITQQKRASISKTLRAFRYNPRFYKLCDSRKLQEWELVELLRKGAEVDAPYSGRTPLAAAIVNGDLRTAELLLRHGADPHFQKGGINKFPNVHGRQVEVHMSMLDIALEQEPPNFAMVELLIRYHADINYLPHQNWLTPLYSACYTGRLHVAQWLLDHGADFKIYFDGVLEGDYLIYNTPLHAAARIAHIPILQLLLDKGEDINTTNKRGHTILHISCAKMDKDETSQLLFGPFIDWVLDRGSDLERKDNNGNTPLHLTVYYGHVEAASILVRQGADVNAHNLYSTAFIDLLKSSRTSRHGSSKVDDLGEIFIGKGVKIRQTNLFGDTPLTAAASGNCPHTLAKILDHGLHPFWAKMDAYSAMNLAEPFSECKEVLDNFLSRTMGEHSTR